MNITTSYIVLIQVLALATYGLIRYARFNKTDIHLNIWGYRAESALLLVGVLPGYDQSIICKIAAIVMWAILAIHILLYNPWMIRSLERDKKAEISS